MTGDSVRQHTPKCCHSRNQGLCASISSCLRLAAEMSLALSGLISGASNISCSCSISSMMRSMSMRLTHLVRSANGSNRSGIGLSSAVGTFASPRQHPQRTPAALAYGHRVPCGHDQNTPTKPGRGLFGSLGAKRCSSSGRAGRGRGR